MPSATLTVRAISTVASTSIRVFDSSATFRTYPYEQFLITRRDLDYNFSFSALDRGKYDRAASVQALTDRTVRTLVLENEFLRLTFIPELGGRLFQITYKPTNQNLFYNNTVLKPTGWGPASQGGWLAIGGMEWALPVNEHGYEWGTPWSYAVTQDASGATISLTDTDAMDRVRTQIQVTLPYHAAYVVVHPRIENPTGSPVRLQFWINAQLALGAIKNVSPGTEFILPTDSVLVHSTGIQLIPHRNVPPGNATKASAPLGWSQVGGRDLSRYSNWDDYLGVFAATVSRPFVGAYNHDTELGIARVFPPDQAPGVKLFAFGSKFCCRSQFSDDGSDYFELWGGLPRTFFADDDVTIGGGQSREWSEYWVPFAKTGGLSVATRDAVLNVENENGTARASAYSAIPRKGILVLTRDGNEIKRWPVGLVPGTAFSATMPTEAGHLQLHLLDVDGITILESK